MSVHRLYPVLSVCWLLLTGCGPDPDRVKISPATTDSILVINRGNFSTYQTRRITNRDTIAAICQLMARANRVSSDTVDFKAKVRFAMVNMYKKDGSVRELTYGTTYKDGNLVWYKGSCFRSDSLYVYLK